MDAVGAVSIFDLNVELGRARPTFLVPSADRPRQFVLGASIPMRGQRSDPTLAEVCPGSEETGSAFIVASSRSNDNRAP